MFCKRKDIPVYDRCWNVVEGAVEVGHLHAGNIDVLGGNAHMARRIEAKRANCLGSGDDHAASAAGRLVEFDKIVLGSGALEAGAIYGKHRHQSTDLLGREELDRKSTRLNSSH